MMTQEEKELLLKDLCARLPYGVKVQNVLDNSIIIDLKECLYCLPAALITNFKPYLRPMSSMSNEECNEFFLLSDDIIRCGERGYSCGLSIEAIDWLNSHHFDYRGLIGKGLALEAPEGMYKTE